MTFPSSRCEQRAYRARSDLHCVQTIPAQTSLPRFGHPTSGTLTNCTGLPLAGLLLRRRITRLRPLSTLLEWDANRMLGQCVHPGVAISQCRWHNHFDVGSAQIQQFYRCDHTNLCLACRHHIGCGATVLDNQPFERIVDRANHGGATLQSMQGGTQLLATVVTMELPLAPGMSTTPPPVMRRPFPLRGVVKSNGRCCRSRPLVRLHGSQ